MEYDAKLKKVKAQPEAQSLSHWLGLGPFESLDLSDEAMICISNEVFCSEGSVGCASVIGGRPFLASLRCSEELSWPQKQRSAGWLGKGSDGVVPV